MSKLLETLRNSPIWTSQGGGVATLMLLAFLVLAVPLTLGALQTSGQLNRNSRVYDDRLTAMYNASSGMEAVLWELLDDPTFDDGLTPSAPDKVINVDNNNETVTVTITKIFTVSPVTGVGLVVSKAVTPDSAPVDTLTTFTYTITIKNEGTDDQTVIEIKDWMAPGFTYVSGSTGGDITTSNPDIKAESPWGDNRYVPNHAGSLPYPWNIFAGNDKETGTHTPSQNVWEEVPEYWETPPYDTTGLVPVIPAGKWKHHKQPIKSPVSTNKWRWKVQLVSGAQVTDLFTSSDAAVPTIWQENGIDFTAGDISIQDGDKVRLRLEVWSNESDSANRLVEYRWGGGNNYIPDSHIPNLAPCSGGVEELKWDQFSPVVIGALEEKTLTFQATATLADGTYPNQAEAKYEPWWSPGEEISTRSPYTAEVTVGTGSQFCGFESPIQIGQSVSPAEADNGVATEFTYTIDLTNVAPVTVWVCKVEDRLPATFTYVTGQTTGAIDRDPAEVKWLNDDGRYEIKWEQDQWPENNGDYMFSITSGQTKSFSFKVLGTLESGLSYDNEVGDIKYQYGPKCFKPHGIAGGVGDGGSTGGAIAAIGIFDIQAVAADGTVLARVQLSAVNGTAAILSWQEF